MTQPQFHFSIPPSNAEESNSSMSSAMVETDKMSPPGPPPPPPPGDINNSSSSWSPLKSRDALLTASFQYQHNNGSGKSPPVGSPVTTAGMKTLRRGYSGTTGTSLGSNHNNGESSSSSSKSSVTTTITKNGNPSTSKIVDQALTVVQAHQRQSCSNGNENTNNNARNLDDRTSSATMQQTTTTAQSISTTEESMPDDVPPREVSDEFSSDISSSAEAAEIEASSSSQQQQQQQPVNVFCPPANSSSFRKISKKRRKENGKDGIKRSSFHHTKSSKEYLRKAQEALRMKDSQRQHHHEQTVSLGGLSPRSNFVKQSLGSAVLLDEGADDGTHNMKGRLFTEDCTTSSDSEAAAAASVPTPEPFRSQSCGDVFMGWSDSSSRPAAATAAKVDLGYEDPDAAAAKVDLGYEDPDAAAAKDGLGYEDPDAAAAKDGLGYEDPDAAAACRDSATRRVGPARRRGSVTKFSLQAANAAKAATERILRLQGLSSSLSAMSCEQQTMNNDEPEVHHRRAPRRSGGMMKNSFEQHLMSQNITTSSVTQPPSHEGPSQSHPEPPSRGAAAAAAALPEKTGTNLYGYEDHDSAPPQSQARRRHPRPRRRGSVTKYSLQAAATVAVQAPPPLSDFTPAEAKSLQATETVTVQAPPPLSPFTPAEAKSLQAEDTVAVQAPPPLSPFTPAEAKSMQDDRMVSRRSGPEHDSSSDDDSSSVDERVEVVVQLKPPAPSRQDRLQDANYSPFFAKRRPQLSRRNSGDDPVNTNSGVDSNQGTSPRRRSIGELSVSSRSFRSRIGRSNSAMSQNSINSYEDDADSVANDLESLCSIHDRGMMDEGMMAPPPPPVLSPLGTPQRSRNGGSLSNFLMGRYTGAAPGSQGRTNDGGSTSQHSRESANTENLPFIAFPEDSDVPVISSTGGTFAAPLKRTPSTSSSNRSYFRQAPSAAPSFSSTCSGCT
eukprot:CAMPEP_0113481276 /NCGR_PEP_ID=MMETSP0014_2-20120614/22326_1 /TAXON_ID=2857 /ORGANISM="Nitzschia sp." /LENGTH=947 /DNA_ID=CAMNT_0000374769 /DNA_START=314 /DNA_END=3157 /DNA_ORIENTATION=+ /assembly_acc=CAM_ASM_000159